MQIDKYVIVLIKRNKEPKWVRTEYKYVQTLKEARAYIKENRALWTSMNVYRCGYTKVAL